MSLHGGEVLPPKDNTRLIMLCKGRRERWLPAGRPTQPPGLAARLGLRQVRVGGRVLEVEDEGGLATLPMRFLRAVVDTQLTQV